ncbi:MAG: WecB/TagA/CpsF family glycosyltransferase [Oscillospiraceae bacterium]|nr:WecB/TagA/CpsF family glycosyltransferase [Oscillospiraceae bacterium]
MRIDVLGVGFDDLTASEAASAAVCHFSGGAAAPAYAVTPNPEIVWLARKNSALRDAISGAALVLPDGIGIVYGARILGTPLKERVPGIDFAAALLASLAERGGGVYLLGAKPGVAETAGDKLRETYPGLVIAGTRDGYFEDDAAVIAEINAKAPDLLLVCLGAPKQELWIAKNIAGLAVGLAIGLGGALDVWAGTVKRAPERWRRLGLEWLYRLLREPRRIGRMMSLPKFLFAVIWRRIRG